MKIKLGLTSLLLFSILYSLFSIFPSLAQARYIIPPELWLPESDFLKAIEAGEQGEMNKQYFDLRTIENLMLTTETAVGGMPVEVARGPTGPVYAREGGAIGIVSNLVATLYATQPASSVEYLADVGRNLGLAPPAYAQGLGWTAFSPVLGLWKTFRNIAYLAFVVIFVVIGFMIMFRAKIDPQTVISIQNALPRIIVTLLLITFSYAIAGFIIDLGQVVTRIIGNILVVQSKLLGTDPGYGPEYTLKDLLSADIFKLINPLRNVDELTAHITGAISVGPESLLKPIAWVTARVVFWIAGFFIMFKIFFALLGPYIAIVLSVVFAPLQILIGALPGAGGFGSWLKGFLANVMVFPVTFAMLCIAAIFKSGPTLYQCPPDVSPLGPGAAWCTLPDRFIIPWAPVTIGNWGEVAGELIGFGILFMIPQVANIVKGVIAGKGAPPEAGAAPLAEIREAISKVPLLGTFVRV